MSGSLASMSGEGGNAGRNLTSLFLAIGRNCLFPCSSTEHLDRHLYPYYQKQACTWIMPITGLCIILTWSLVAANIAGHPKRTFVNGLEFMGYAAGNIFGLFLFIPTEAPVSERD
jgi:hypothetical protein